MALPDNPLTRGEQYLSAIAGEDTQIPDVPLTRMEQYLDYIAKNSGSGGGGGSGTTATPRIVKTASDTTPALDPNKLYVFPEMATLTPTLATPSDNTIVNEYHFVFDSGATATVLTLPATILQPNGFTVEANMHYEISILEGAMTAQGWAVTSA